MAFRDTKFIAKQKNPIAMHRSVEKAFAKDVPNRELLMILGLIEAKISRIGVDTRSRIRNNSFLLVKEKICDLDFFDLAN